MSYFDDHLDLTQHELRNAVIQPLAADPSNPIEGQIYYNTVSKKKRIFNGTVWNEEGAATGNVTQSANSGAAGRMKVSAAADKTVTDYAGGAGIVKSDANGNVSPATAGTDYSTPGSAETLTNKTFDANGAGNSLSNLELDNFAANVIDTDGTLAANSDTRLATQKAVKTYIGNQVASLGKPMGGIDASTNPNYPAATPGQYYRITVAGRIGGAAGPLVEVNDIVQNFISSAAGNHATVGANWTISQANTDAATETTPGIVALATQAETEAKTVTSKAVTPADLVNFPIKQEFLFGDAAALTYTLTHNRNSKNVIVQVRDAATDEVHYPKIVNATVNTTVISGYISAPGVQSMRAVIIG